MNDVHKSIDPTPTAADGELSFIDLLIVLAKHKKKLLVFPVAAALLAAGVSFVVPDVYSANTKLLPPQQPQSGASALLTQLGGAAGMAAGAVGLKSPSDVYIGMLKSRTIADRLIARFDLKTAYQADGLDGARQQLGQNTMISAGKEGLIVIEVEDASRERVAPLANAYVEELMRLTRVLAVSEASQRRMFFEQQLEQSKDKLAKAEVSLKQALGRRGVISVDAESAAIVETGARLKAQISGKEIQLNSMKAFVTPSNPEYRRATEELSSLRQELSRLENGRADTPELAGSAPSSGFDNIKLLRDVKYQQMLYEVLAKQYEAARLDEAKDSSLVQVLDPAVAPERRARPKRALIVLLSSLFALFACVVLVFVMEVKHRSARSPRLAAKWAELSSYLRFGKTR